MLEMLEMLGESVSTGQNQGVSIGAKPEETMEEMGGKNCRNGEIVVLNAACTLVIPGAPHFWFYFRGAAGHQAVCGIAANCLSSSCLRFLIHVTGLISAPTVGIVGAVTSIVAGAVLRTGLPVCTLQFLTFHNLLI